MTITPTQGPAGTPNDWVLRRSDPGGEEFMPGEDTTAGESGLGFGDLLDAINPLQHLPIVGTLYRALTGDTISETARMAGGALYGGPAGLVGALANLMVEKETGSDIGGTALAWVTDEPAAGDAGTAVAGAVAGADPALPETAALPINAAPVTIAAAMASPAAIQTSAQEAPALIVPASTGAAGTAATAAGLTPDPENPGTTVFAGRSADRLDAFIRQANAVRRSNPVATRAPSATTDPTRLQAAALKPPGVTTGAEAQKSDAKQGDAELAVAGGDAGSVNDWMLRALEKYEHMRKQET